MFGGWDIGRFWCLGMADKIRRHGLTDWFVGVMTGRSRDMESGENPEQLALLYPVTMSHDANPCLKKAGVKAGRRFEAGSQNTWDADMKPEARRGDGWMVKNRIDAGSIPKPAR